jgi:site-specific recombinase
MSDAPPGNLAVLKDLVDFFRKGYQQHGSIEGAFGELEQAMAIDPVYQEGLIKWANYVLKNYDYVAFFTQYSLLDQSSFLHGVLGRIKHRIIPQVPPETDIQHLLLSVFRLREDKAWLLQLPADGLDRLFGPDRAKLDTRRLVEQLDLSIQSLGGKIGSFGLDHRVRRLFRRLELDVRPFARLQEIVAGKPSTEEVAGTFQLLKAIRANIISLRLRKNEIGTSLKLTYESKKTLDSLAILEGLLHLRTAPDKKEHWQRVFQAGTEGEIHRMGLGRFINGHLDLLALEIVEHTARSGETYIADNRSEYYGMLRGSMLGGLLIALFAAVKIWLYDLPVDKFPQALLFSINYATCFVLVKVLGGTIATKQPAMVASTIIKHIDQNNNLRLGELKEIVDLIKKASRSQFISFVGNLSAAFPLAILIAWGFDTLGSEFVTIEKGEKLLADIWPFAGGALAFAAIAGVFLALSGIISGYVDNKVVASDLERRLDRHPLLQRILPTKTRKKFAGYVCKKLGGLSGNVSLGFLLGMASFLGYLTNLPIDIRHIAFSSANFGFAFQTLNIPPPTLALGALAILLIGAINFIVSFGITLYITLRSRGITTGKTFNLLGRLCLEISFRPWTFLLFPAKPATEK